MFTLKIVIKYKKMIQNGKKIDMLDPDDRHYKRMKTDLNERLYKNVGKEDR